MVIKETSLPEEKSSDLGRHNNDADSPNWSSNAGTTDRGFSDAEIVVVKPESNEDAAMHPRIKLLESGGRKKTLEAKGRIR